MKTKRKTDNHSDKITPGFVRMQIYDYLESEGFKLNDERHKKLSLLLKENANAKNEEVLSRTNYQIAEITNKLHNREKAFKVRNYNSIPILCKTEDEHKSRGCYYECKFKEIKK